MVTYKDCKKFSNKSFQLELSSAMERYGDISFAAFHSELLYLFGKYAPVKKNHIRAYQKNFMDKKLNQAINVRFKNFRKLF